MAIGYRPAGGRRGVLAGIGLLLLFALSLSWAWAALGLDPNATPQFTTTPGQVAFTPDGTQLVVTTKGNGNDIDVFGVGFGGRLSAKATVNAEPGTVPFAIAFDPFGHLVIAEAGPNALSTFDLSRNGTVSLLSRTAPARPRPAGSPRPGRSCSPPTPARPPRAASPRRLAGS